jgi:DNA-binding NarL/FixJ family response regulator
MQALHDHQWLGRTSAAGWLDAPKGSISDELLIRALQPLSLLQIGLHQQLLGGCRGQVVVRRVRSVEHALSLLAGEEFDALILGPDVADEWPTSAYERLAETAGSTPVVVAADPVEPMLVVKRRQDRADDEIISSAAPSLALQRITLAAVLRSRALAAPFKSQLD